MSHTIPALNLRFYTMLMRIRPTILVDLYKRIWPLERSIVSWNDIRLSIDPISIFGQAVLSGDYESSLSAWMMSLLEAGGVFIDVGANEGYYSVLASRRVGENGRVIAIEPQTRLKRIIEVNLELNNCKNVTFLATALGDGTDGEITLFLSPSTMNGSSSIVNKYFVGSRQKSPSKTLQQVFDDTGIMIADVVKIDVEGYEPEVIYGALPVLHERRIRHLFIDYHEGILLKRGIEAAAIDRLICNAGYTSAQPDTLSGYVLYKPLLK